MNKPPEEYILVDEQRELDQYEQAELLVRLVKARLHAKAKQGP